MAIEKIRFTGVVSKIPIRKINVINPRKRDKEKFDEIVESIKQVGLLKPILINGYYLQEKGRYELLCGEGRLLACKRLGHENLLAEIVNCSRKTGYVISLVENMARKRYTTIELAKLIYNLRLKGTTIEDLCKITNRSKGYIMEYLRLMKNGEERLIVAVEENRLPISLAARIARSPDGKIQDLLMEAAEQKMMSSNDVDKVRKLIEDRMSGKRKIRKNTKERDSISKASLSVNQLKKNFRQTIKKQEKYIEKCQRLESTVSLLQGFIETLLKNEHFKNLIIEEGIKIP